MNIKHIAIFPLLIGLSACNHEDESIDISQPITINFAESTHDFEAIFSDYPESTANQNNELFYQLEAEYTALPSDVSAHNAWWLQGNNHSDDLLMAIKGKINNLASNRLYRAEITIDLTTNIPSNCFGIGGAPGESVYVKLAASTQEPINEVGEGMYRLNIDIGNQSQSGIEGQTVGDIANNVDCMEAETYKRKTLQTTIAIDVMTNDYGEFWLLAGTDSGFEGLSYYYINQLEINISE